MTLAIGDLSLNLTLSTCRPYLEISLYLYNQFHSRHAPTTD